ncbi:acyltransferase [Azospirillum argentinense]|uniref:Acyltransferase n=1 Tax=Azospirillum argentinense TaxID=2970906 RepID=A0ABW8VBC4_9PROT
MPMDETGHDPLSTFQDVAFGNNVQVIGYSHIAIGPGTVVGDNSWLNVCDRSNGRRLVIGSKVCIGRNAMINAADGVEIGDFCLFAPRVYISDVDHEYEDVTLPIVTQGLRRHGILIVEENCWLGINTVLSGGLSVGRGSVVAANSVVLADVPPFSVVAGIPARVIKMYDPELMEWRRIRSAEDTVMVDGARERHPLPDRARYRAALHANSRIDRLPAVIAGRGQHLP